MKTPAIFLFNEAFYLLEVTARTFPGFKEAHSRCLFVVIRAGVLSLSANWDVKQKWDVWSAGKSPSGHLKKKQLKQSADKWNNVCLMLRGLLLLLLFLYQSINAIPHYHPRGLDNNNNVEKLFVKPFPEEKLMKRQESWLGGGCQDGPQQKWRRHSKFWQLLAVEHIWQPSPV